MRRINSGALIRLKAARYSLTWQQYQTLRGQVLSGDAEGAMKGMDRILRKGQREKVQE